jgi:hypothetical protein
MRLQPLPHLLTGQTPPPKRYLSPFIHVGPSEKNGLLLIESIPHLQCQTQVSMWSNSLFLAEHSYNLGFHEVPEIHCM